MWLVLLLTTALAQDPEWSKTDIDTSKGKETRVDAEIGGSAALGNTVFYTVNAQAVAWHKWNPKNKIGGMAGLLIGQSISDADSNGNLSEEERAVGMQFNAQRYSALARYDRYLGERNSIYVLFAFLRDKFAGYDWRLNQQVGYSHEVIKTDKVRFVTEGGIDWAQEDYVEGVEPNRLINIVSIRAMLAVDVAFTESTSLTNETEFLLDFLQIKNLRWINLFGFNTRVTDIVTFRLSYNVFFDNFPVEGFRKWDQQWGVSLVVHLR